ncbi:MAG: hypothetical protein H0U71_03215 [Gammaproteobacteria bacterium]|nr:hypothetical protein [Gammaproteobacteria bacterium]
MPSELLKQAVKGNEVALTELTYQFENNKVPVQDLIAINNSKQQDQNSRYLRALSFYFYTPVVDALCDRHIGNKSGRTHR